MRGIHADKRVLLDNQSVQVDHVEREWNLARWRTVRHDTGGRRVPAPRFVAHLDELGLDEQRGRGRIAGLPAPDTIAHPTAVVGEHEQLRPVRVDLHVIGERLFGAEEGRVQAVLAGAGGGDPADTRYCPGLDARAHPLQVVGDRKGRMDFVSIRHAGHFVRDEAGGVGAEQLALCGEEHRAVLRQGRRAERLGVCRETFVRLARNCGRAVSAIRKQVGGAAGVGDEHE